LVRRPRNCHL